MSSIKYWIYRVSVVTDNSFMLIIKARRLGLCTRDTAETIAEVDYKSQRIADYFSSTYSRK